jgi:hypothetical protein
VSITLTETFIQYLSDKYSSTDQLILELLRQERVSNLKYGAIFATCHPVIDYTLGKNEAHDLFIVVRLGQYHISCVFTVELIDISHLHWILKDLPENHPQRAVVLLRIATCYMDEVRRSDKQNHLAGKIISNIDAPKSTYKLCRLGSLTNGRLYVFIIK